jgi:ATP-dependent RNA helicase SUPV3L1/SUV3
MLKPAPTRLRLVLWALKEGLDEFPSAPPPGLVTLPAPQGVPPGYYARAGYRLAGERMIRIDMLERLADMIRGLDAQAGFEASADMLSITGLSQEQFARLMEGLGYVATPGLRPKRKAQPAPVPEVSAEPTSPEAAAEAGETSPEVADGPAMEAPAEPAAEAPAAPPDGGEPAPAEPASTESAPVEAVDPASTEPAPSETAPVEMESFFTFARAPRRRPDRAPREARKPREGERPRGADRPRRADAPRDGAPPPEAEKPREERPREERVRADGPRADGPRKKHRREDGPHKGKPEAPKPAPRPARPEKPIDPDNPFAALMALKTRG